MKFSIWTLGLSTMVLCVACQTNSPQIINSTTQPFGGLLEVTINLAPNGAGTASLKDIGTSKLGARSATTINLGAGFSSFFSRQAVGFHDDELGFSNGGLPSRHVYATFKISNSSATAFDNLTFWGINLPSNQFGSIFTSVKDATGTTITDGNVIRAITPMHGSSAGLQGGLLVNSQLADLQFFTPAEVAEVQAQISSVYGISNSNVLQYGFVARDNLGSGRIISSVGGTGFVTFAFKAPLVSPRASNAFGFSFVVAYGDQDRGTVSQSFEEQSFKTIAGSTVIPAGAKNVVFGNSRILLSQAETVTNLCQVITAVPSGTFASAALHPSNATPTNGNLDGCYKAGGTHQVAFGAGEIQTALNGAKVKQSSGELFVGVQTDLTTFKFKKFDRAGNLIATSTPISGSAFGASVEIQNMSSLHIDNNGKVILIGTANTAGHTEMAIAVYNSSTLALDTSFSTDGLLLIPLNAASNINVTGLRITTFGTGANTKYFFAGNSSESGSKIFIAKTNNVGILDTSFASDGTTSISNVTTNTFNVLANFALDSTGSIYFAAQDGSSKYVTKLTVSGIKDTSFNTTGTTFISGFSITDIKLDSTGRIILAGEASGFPVIARILPTGAMDTSFDSDGINSTFKGCPGQNRVQNLTITNSGDYVLSGNSSNNNNSGDFMWLQYSAINGAASLSDCYDLDQTGAIETLQDVAYDSTLGRFYMVGTNGVGSGTHIRIIRVKL
jgi:uncharacterized delta-60 repeat protein